MESSSGNTSKMILRIFIMLILSAVAGSLFFHKDISNYYREWQLKGGSEETIALPQVDAESPETQSDDTLTSSNLDQKESPTANYGMIAPNLLELNPQPQLSDSNAQNANNESSLLDSEFHNTTTPLVDEQQTFSELEPVDGVKPVGGVEVTSSSGQQMEVGGIVPPLREDSVISRYFISDLASLMVNSYYPPGTHDSAKGSTGYVQTSLLTLNLHYSTDSKRYFKRSHAETLQYVLIPSMLEALYKLYANTLLETMQMIASQEQRQFKGTSRVMTAKEQRMMFAHYASLTKGVAAVFEACAASPATIQRLDSYYLAAVNAYAQNQAYILASIAYDQSEPGQVSANNTTLRRAKSTYERSVKARETAHDDLLRTLKRYPGVRGLDDSNILYTVGWINRRLADHNADSDTLSVISRIMNGFASRMTALTEE